jgi:hypothetical protein
MELVTPEFGPDRHKFILVREKPVPQFLKFYFRFRGWLRWRDMIFFVIGYFKYQLNELEVFIDPLKS